MSRRLRTLAGLRVRRIACWPWPALELQRADGSGWLICHLPNPKN
ncbi:hypothetical protein [Kitasatospora sp. A2-31]|nr:hypothetical protein [Kitasatospora sp. A2-31]